MVQSGSLNMKSPSILLSIVAAVTMTFGLSTSSVQAHDGSADLNHDGWVDSYDITILLADWGAVADGVLHSDINGDFEVGAADFAILIGALGPVAPAVSCKAGPPSLGDKLSNVITGSDQTLYVTPAVTSTDWTPNTAGNTYLLCNDNNGPQALIQGNLSRTNLTQFTSLALMSGEDDIVLSSDKFFTPAKKGTTPTTQSYDTNNFLNNGISLNFTPTKLANGYVLVTGQTCGMIFSYTAVTTPNPPNCTLTSCKLAGILGSPTFTNFPDQNFSNGSNAVECTAPPKGKTVSNNTSILVTPANPSTIPFDLTVLSTAGFDPNGGNLIVAVDFNPPSNKILVSYTSTSSDSTTFIGCKALQSSIPNAAPFTIKAGMPISMTNSSKPYTINFSDLSGLSAARAGASATGYGIYAMGMATGSGTTPGTTAPYWLDVTTTPNSMHFVAATPGSNYPVKTINDLTTIGLDSNVELKGARIYFFVLPLFHPILPTIPVGSQPPQPTTATTGPVAFIEFTVPAPDNCDSEHFTCTAPGYRIPGNATFDVQQVDAFQFPMTMAWQKSALDPFPTSNLDKDVIFGQTICSIHSQPDGSASRESILSTFHEFFVVNSPYLDLKMAPLAFNFPPARPQAAGILAPSHYLETNVGSELNTVFDSDLKTLFSTAANGLKILGNQSDPAGIAQSYYDVTFVNVAYPTDPAPHVPPLHIPALELKTSSSPPSGLSTGENNTFYIFSPTDTSIITTTPEGGVTTYIKGTLTQPTSPSYTLTLTIDPNEDLYQALVGNDSTQPVGIGMYVFSNVSCSSLGNWMDTTHDVKSLIQISEITVSSSKQLTITLSSATQGTALLCTDAYFQFSRQPWVANLLTSGNMVFSNDGFFTDRATQYSQKTGGPLAAYLDVLSNLENQIVTALNRGVLVTPANGKILAKLTTNDSKDWSKQTGWYTPGTTYNEYSCFVHTVQITNAASGHSIPISYAPFNSRKSGGGLTMSAAYGFAFDESSQVGDLTLVPSKLDGTVTPGSIITFTFGPWIDSSCH